MENFQMYENKILPTVALRGLVMFPNMQLHFDVGREKTLLAIKRAMMNDNLVFMVAQKDELMDEISSENLYQIGVVAKIKQIINAKNKTAKVVAEGLYRARAIKYTSGESFLYAEIEEVPLESVSVLTDSNSQAYLRILNETFNKISSLIPSILISICNAVIPCLVPATLKSISP